MLILAPKEEVEGAVCAKVDAAEVEDIITNIVPDMETILKNTGGLGLAAPQVGIKKQFFISQKAESEGYNLYFNAFYTQDASRTTVREGCLTYGKGNMVEVKRYKAIRFIYDEYDAEKKSFSRKFRKVRGSEAIVLQHETDHLSGITIFMK